MDYFLTERQKQIQELASSPPIVITGDFNSTPDSEVYRIITSTDNSVLFYDAKFKSVTPHHGPDGTFNGFKFNEHPEHSIDFIFVSANFEVLSHAVLTDHWNGRYPSDHFLILAEIRIK